MEATEPQKDIAPPEEAKGPANPALRAVGVQFRPAGKIYTFASEDAEISAGDLVIVESEGGTALGQVVAPPAGSAEAPPQHAKRVLRRASPEEIDADRRRKEQALSHFALCREKVKERALPMKLVDAQIEEDGRKIVFSFFSEGRIDFRQLVKDLAGQLHMRIEMRQVGARDEAKHRGCIASCGQMTCCSLHLRQFQSISISMAKHQGLAPNPAKLTGMCGKLKCCLAYEHEVYNEYRQGLPKMGASVESPEGAGKIVGHNVLKRECTVRLFRGGETRCPCEKCRVLTPAEREAAMDAARKEYEAGIEKMRQRREKRESRDASRQKREERRNGQQDASAPKAAPAEPTPEDDTIDGVKDGETPGSES